MNIIEIMNQYGVIIAIAGILTCVLCGLIKVPIARMIRKNCLDNGLDNKIASDRIRNVCNTVVVVLSALFISVWHIATHGIKAMLTTRVYADILATFTAAKLVYMIYEGAGATSLKKVFQKLFEVVKNRNNASQADKNIQYEPENKLFDTITSFLTDNISLPLTSEQRQELQKLLEIKNNK